MLTVPDSLLIEIICEPHHGELNKLMAHVLLFVNIAPTRVYETRCGTAPTPQSRSVADLLYNLSKVADLLWTSGFAERPVDVYRHMKLMD